MRADAPFITVVALPDQPGACYVVLARAIDLGTGKDAAVVTLRYYNTFGEHAANASLTPPCCAPNDPDCVLACKEVLAPEPTRA
jgi:hypothetical protein